MVAPPDDLGADRSLLILDDDEPFLRRLSRAMEKRGFEVTAVDSVAAGRAAVADSRPPAYAVVDLRLEDGNGLDLVGVLRARRPDARIVVLTGYGAIASAVAAVKIGATDYLAKPADANDVTGALLARDVGQARAARRIRCRPTGCAGSTSSASTSSATATSRRPRGGSTCTAARCSASSPSAARSRLLNVSAATVATGERRRASCRTCEAV